MAKDIKEIKTKAEARQEAIEWQFRQSNLNLSCQDVCDKAEYFRVLGKKFGLIREFKENCIL